MSHSDIVHAWKDEDYRLSLGNAELSRLPENPAGLVELSDEDLGNVAGGHTITFQLCMTYSAFCSSWGCDSRFNC